MSNISVAGTPFMVHFEGQKVAPVPRGLEYGPREVITRIYLFL